MTADEMIRFEIDKCITHIQKELEFEILDGVYTVSQENALGFNKEEIKKMLLMFKPMQKELEIYKKAFKMACRGLGYEYADKGRSTTFWTNYFLQKARGEE